jgi:hypothetical protein
MTLHLFLSAVCALGNRSCAKFFAALHRLQAVTNFFVRFARV